MKTLKTSLMRELPQVQAKIKYNFRNTEFLITALTHSSYSHVHGGPCNERMEFLGDALLDFVVAEVLYNKFPERNEGEYTLVRADVVDTDSLSREIDQMGLIDFMLVSSGLEKQGISVNKNKKIYADLYEALLCAIYLDGGLSEAKKFIFSTLREELDQAMYIEAGRDFKTLLKEAAEKNRFDLKYILLRREGTDNNPTFYYAAMVDGKSMGEGYGSSVKEAQSYAAKRALKKMNLLSEDYDKSN
ncbi:MAG: ribonuclease III [Clostridiales bacterium]|nr:ribonuclease III [Clostridiales bacterium]